MGMIFNGTCDLGDTLSAIRSFSHFGKLSPGTQYGMLHGALHAALAEYEEIPQEDLDTVSYQAGAFLEEFRSQLSDHEKWLLNQLVSCNGVQK